MAAITEITSDDVGGVEADISDINNLPCSNMGIASEGPNHFYCKCRDGRRTPFCFWRGFGRVVVADQEYSSCYKVQGEIDRALSEKRIQSRAAS